MTETATLPAYLTGPAAATVRPFTPADWNTYGGAENAYGTPLQKIGGITVIDQGGEFCPETDAFADDSGVYLFTYNTSTVTADTAFWALRPRGWAAPTAESVAYGKVLLAYLPARVTVTELTALGFVWEEC